MENDNFNDLSFIGEIKEELSQFAISERKQKAST